MRPETMGHIGDEIDSKNFSDPQERAKVVRDAE